MPLHVSQTTLSLLNYECGVRCIRSPNKQPTIQFPYCRIFINEKFFFFTSAAANFSIAYANTSGDFLAGSLTHSQTNKADDNLISIRRQGFINIVIKAHSAVHCCTEIQFFFIDIQTCDIGFACY